MVLELLSQDSEQVHVRFAVRDTGIGMAPQALNHIFDGFSQAEGSTTRQYGGTGLGLAISRRLVKLMGGQLLVRSELGQGSTFWFDLTLARPQAHETLPSTGPMPLPPPVCQRRLAGWRLLLVEDNPNNRQVASELLSDEGAEVSMAHNGAEGVQAVLNAPDLIDAVLMDVQMPVMDGLAATRALHQALGDDVPPIIAMTANALPADMSACLEAGMVAHVGKPFDLENLITTLLTHGRPGRRPGTAGSAAPRTRSAPLQEESRPLVQDLDVALDEALARLGHREDVYLRLLTHFCDDLPQAATEARQAWRRGDRAALQAWLHSFKGLAGTLGLRRLQTLATEAERACPDVIDTALDPAWLQTLLQAMDDAHARLPALQAALSPAAASAHHDVPAPLNVTLLHQQLQDLIKLLGRSDMNALEACAQLQAAHEAALGEEALGPLNDAMARLDFTSAIEHCQRLLTRWPLE